MLHNSFVPHRSASVRGATLAVLFICAAIALSACGSSAQTSATPQATSPPAAGDIADTANYLTYQGKGYTLKYVEGWGIQLGSSAEVTISDKDSSETVALVTPRHGSISTFASHDLAGLQSTAPKFQLLARHTAALPAGQSPYVQYRSLSPQDPVTGKRVTVLIDRYYIAGPRSDAILTLATPLGVDNVDAFRLIARSFRWA